MLWLECCMIWFGSFLVTGYICVLQKHEDPTLMRFLIARSMDPEKAAKMFVQWQKWRASMVPNGFIADSEVPDELEAKKIYLQGLSKNGCPVMIVKASKHFPSKDQPQFKSKFSILYCFYFYLFIFFSCSKAHFLEILSILFYYIESYIYF